MREIWKDIENYEGIYQVSNHGRIYNILSGRILGCSVSQSGYVRLRLCKNGIQENCNVHRLVAKAFIPNMNNYPIINHKDENKKNNHADNLEWCNHKYNNTYISAINKYKTLANQNYTPVIQFTKDNVFISEYNSVNEAGELNNITPCCISSCLTGHTKSAGGFIWKYKNK